MSKELRFTKKGELDTRGKRQLSPCPFCGCTNCKIAKGYKGIGIGKYALCTNCGGQTKIFYFSDEAIKAWNRRCPK